MPEPEQPTASCTWTVDDFHDSFVTECGQAFQFFDQGPTENGFKYCPYCGFSLVVGTPPAGD